MTSRINAGSLSAREINAAIDVSQLYEKIDLSKTEFMRDKDGNPCGGWKNTSIKYMAASDAERFDNLEKEAAKSKITTGLKNSYGLIYDFDYRMQLALFYSSIELRENTLNRDYSETEILR